MSNSTLWRGRCRETLHHLCGLFAVALIYLTSELNIWGLSLVLSSAQLQYFASIIAMISVFSVMTVASKMFRCCDRAYRRWAKARVDFLNANLGIGFSVPIIMLDHVLGIRDISFIVATSAITNLVSWAAVFLFSLAVLVLVSALPSYFAKHVQQPRNEVDFPCGGKEQEGTPHSDHCQPYVGDWKYLTSEDSVTKAEGQKPAFQDQGRIEQGPNRSSLEHEEKSFWYLCKSNGYFFFCLAGIVALGIPLEVMYHDSRLLDGFTLWLCWIISVRLQRVVKFGHFLTANVRWRHSLATMINPVLITTLLMLGYTRLRGILTPNEGIINVLESFSSGTPLYSIWTALITATTVPGNPQSWFGAGDFALSLLECGIVAWGFKLYECRNQLFSISGLVVSFLCAISAAGNVFLSVLLAGAMGLHTPEALAFSARSTTLALAKPAVKTLGGNLALNATLVVSNGILGQLLYPYFLGKLSVPIFDNSEEEQKNEKLGADSPVTIATGTAIGINGAALGVSYLYEVNSRAAPYAALSMTIFSVTTVAFTTLEPFKTLLLQLASRSASV